MSSAKDNKAGEPSRAAIGDSTVANVVSRQAGSSSSDPSDWGPRPLTGGISRVPTHSVGRANERRSYIRARLALPLRVQRIAGQRDIKTHSLHTRDISSSGVYFLYPHRLDPGTPIELEVLLVDRPLGHGSVRMYTAAHVVRSQDNIKPGWHGLAAVFDDIRFIRDDRDPLS